MEKVIKEKLNEIEHAYNVKIIMAIESGSRAWGFASPDSDFDVRFIYVRNTDSYLKLEQQRDVIEWQLDDVLDISGWDIQKALKLMYKGNATLFEWCFSNIIYRDSAEFNELKELVDCYFSPKKSLYHYWHMAHKNYQDALKKDNVKLKKYFYSIRPILAAKWILEKGTVPPILFSKLIDSQLDIDMRGLIDSLLEKKKDMLESDTIPRIEHLNEYIENNLAIIKKVADNTGDVDIKSWKMLDKYFLKVIGK